jgi:hypothetical protein
MRPLVRSILIAGAVLVAASAWPARPPAHRPPAPVGLKGAGPAVKPSPPPGAREVLASDPSLSASQRRALQALATEWKTGSRPLEAAVGAATAEFDRFAASAQAEGRTSLAELQQRSAELRELSAELRTRRQAQSEAALAVLTVEQRRRMQTTPGGM